MYSFLSVHDCTQRAKIFRLRSLHPSTDKNEYIHVRATRLMNRANLMFADLNAFQNGVLFNSV